MANLRVLSRLPLRCLVSGLCFRPGKRQFAVDKSLSVVLKEVSSVEHIEKITSEVSLPKVVTYNAKLKNVKTDTALDNALKSLKTASRVEDVQIFIRDLHLDSKLSLKVCKVLNTLYVNNRNNTEFQNQVSEFAKSPEYEKLILSLGKNAHMIYFLWLKSVLLFCKNFGVPFDSLLMQKVLTLILDNINKYSFKEIASIYFTLMTKTDEENELVTALKSACLTCFNLRLDDRTVDSIPADVLYCLSLKSVSENLNVKYLDILTESDLKKFVPVSYLYAMRLFQNQNSYSEADLPKVRMFLEYLKKDIKSTWPENLTLNILQLYKKGLGALYPYDEDLCDIFAIQAINSQLQTACRMLKILCEMYHLNSILIEKVLKLSSELNREDPNLFLNLLSTIVKIIELTGLNYVSDDILDFYKRQIESCEVTFYNAISLALILALTKIENNDVIDKICEVITANSQAILENQSVFLSHKILLIYQWLAITHPKFADKFPNEFLKELFDSLNNFKSLKYRKGVHKIFGGEDYVLENCTSSFKHKFSYVALLDSENRPQDLSSYKNSATQVAIEHILKPDSSKLVIIQEFPVYFRCTFRNTLTQTAIGEIFINNLKNYGYDVFLLQQYEKNNLALYREGIFYLRSAIKDKYGRVNLDYSLLNS